MKILGGRLKGRNFYMPKGIRPTQNLVRKAVFDILKDVRGSVFLDLFAGSGALGLEALSRGAQSVVLVEKDPFCLKVIEKNCALLGCLSGGKPPDAVQRISGDVFATIKELAAQKSPRGDFWVIAGDVFATIKELNRGGKKFDVVFFDPPYGQGLGKKTLKTLAAHDIVHPNSLIVAQTTATEILPQREGRFFLLKEKRYGASVLAIYRVMSYEPNRHLSRKL